MNNAPLVLFPAMPLTAARDVDSDFAGEYAAARNFGYPVGLIDYEDVASGDMARAIRGVPVWTGSEPIPTLMRGWILHSEQYAGLDAVLLSEKNAALVTRPDRYKTCHEMPGWYESLVEFTPDTLIVPGAPPDVESFVAVVQQRFGDEAITIKDFVKSRKHEWLDACFVPNAADTANLLRVTSNFASRQGSDLVGGLVARRYVPLQSTGVHPRSGMPVSNEWRIFRFQSAATLFVPYWRGEMGDERMSEDPGFEGLSSFGNIEQMLRKVDRLGSPFCAVDVGITQDGSPIIIEIGDGQVSDVRDELSIHALIGMLSEAYVTEDDYEPPDRSIMSR